MTGRWTTVTLLLLVVAIVAPSRARAADHDCADFATQAAAQSYYDQQGYSPTNDPEDLDADHDGKACEARPCPCAAPGSSTTTSTSTTPPPSTPAPTPPAPAPAPASPPAAVGTSSGAAVIRVIDGDTIKVRLRSGTRKNVRVLGIDAPESLPTRYGKPDCGGAAASKQMKRLLAPDDKITLTSDPTQDSVDRYGRLLRYVARSGHDVGRKLVRLGLVEVYVFDKPFQRLTDYTAAAAAAKGENRGVWASCGGNFHSAKP